MTHLVPISDAATLNPRYPGDGSRHGIRKVSFLPMAGVSELGHIAEVGERDISEVSKGYTYFEEGDILLAKITPCLENGKAAVVTGLPHRVGFGSTEFHVLRPKEGTDARYLFYMIWNPLFRLEAGRNMTGSAGQKRVPTDFVARFRIPLPALPEQRRIAAILNKADAIRRKRKEGIRLTEELLRSTFLEMFGDPSNNSKGWPIHPMDEVVRETQYGTSQKANGDGKGLPVLRMNNITYEGGIDLTDIKWCEINKSEIPQYTVRRGDLLFNRTNSPELVGKTAVWDREDIYAFAGYLFRVRFDEFRVLPDYASAFLNSSYGKKMLFSRAKPSNNMSNFSAGEFRRIELPVPDLEPQQRFAQAVHNIRSLQQSRAKGLADSVGLFGALVQRAFRGEL